MAFPTLPGAPALLRPPAIVNTALSAVNRATLLVADASIIAKLFQGPRWGVFREGKAVAAADSVVSFEYRQDTKIADYPMEKGAFQSYNKVGNPYDARVQLAKGGTEVDRTLFLEAVEKAALSLDLFELVTPEKVYRSASIQRFDYRRTAVSGVGLLLVEIWLLEVRETVKTAFAATRAPGGAAVVNAGTVQALPTKDDVLGKFISEIEKRASPLVKGGL